MLERVADYIATEGGVPPESALLVGVSGGVDSMTLLDLLRRLGYGVQAAHVNYGLRGDASDADEALVRAYGERHGIPVHVLAVDGRAMQASAGSFQEAARQARYAIFDTIARQEGLAVVTVAHHADDQAETVLMHLFRGAGIEGLCGMPPARPLLPGSAVRLVRPMLGESRRDIEAYAAANEVPWRTDASNSDATYRRNALRNDILPAIEAAFGSGVTAHIASAAERVRAYRAASFEPALAGYLAGALVDDRDERWLREEALRAMPAVWRRRVVLEALARWSPATPRTAASAARVLALLEAQTGRRAVVLGGAFWRERDALVFVHAEAPGAYPEQALAAGGTVELPAGRIELSLPVAPPARPNTGSPNAVWLDASRVSVPLTVRAWRAGDRLHPFGMTHSRNVSDLLTDARVPSHSRAAWPVVLSGATIVWVPGVRLAEAVRIGAGTKQALALTFHVIPNVMRDPVGWQDDGITS